MHALLVNGGFVQHLQVAVDGRWEDAARARVANARDDLSALLERLRPRGEYAIEVFSEDRRGCVRFLGVRFPDVTRSDAEALIRELCGLALAPKTELAAIADWLPTRVGMPVLFDGMWSAVEVGVVDAWRSLGAVRLVRESTKPDARAIAARLLESSQRLAPPPGAVIAAEFACDTPIPHWVAVEIGRSDAAGVVTPSASALAAAAAISG